MLARAHDMRYQAKVGLKEENQIPYIHYILQSHIKIIHLHIFNFDISISHTGMIWNKNYKTYVYMTRVNTQKYTHYTLTKKNTPYTCISYHVYAPAIKWQGSIKCLLCLSFRPIKVCLLNSYILCMDLNKTWYSCCTTSLEVHVGR